MKMVNAFKLFYLLTAFFSITVFAEQSKVLIISSDNSVYRYKQIATEFKTILGQKTYHWNEFDLANPKNDEERLKDILEQEDPDVIYCIGTKAYALARNYAPKKRLLFSAAINWQRLGITEKTYGVANELSPVQEMALIRYFFPSIKKIGLLYNNKYSLEYVDTIKKDALHLDIELISHEIGNVQQVRSALNELLPKVDLFWIISDPIVLAGKEPIHQIFQSAKEFKKPVYAYSDIFIEYGAVLSVSADIATIGRQSANMLVMMDTNKFPEGTVQIPAGSSVTLNRCVIEELKLDYNRDALDSVNKLVDCKK